MLTIVLALLLGKLLGKPEEVNGGERCPTYLFRWAILKGRDWAVYLHHFVGDDWARDLHDHPRRVISIGLRGWYREERPVERRVDGGPPVGIEFKDYHAPWIRTFPAHHIHRLKTPAGSCWTLVIVLKREREWGFWHKGRFIHWRSYDSATADKMKACD